MNKDNNDYDIIGFVFFIEATILYIIDNCGNICLINGTEDQIKQFSEKEYYKIQHLDFLKKDNRNYYIYDMKHKTSFHDENSDFLKNFSIIKFIILDELDEIILKKNPKVELDNSNEIIYHIHSKIQYFTVLKKDKSSYFSQPFKLIMNNNAKIFYTFLYKEQMNIIYCCLQDENINENKSYELLFLSKDKNNLPNNVIVSGFELQEYDIFKCTNRKRFNIMNVKEDKTIYKYNSDLSSFEVIYLIDENNQKTKYGTFDINSFNEIVLQDYILDIDILLFVNKFWYDYDKTKMDNENYNREYYKKKYNLYKSIKNFNDELLRKKENFILSLFKKESLDNNHNFNCFRNYCFFIFFEYLFKKDIFKHNINKFFSLLDGLKNSGYSLYNKIRILSGFVTICLEHNVFPTLIDVNDLDNDNPYNLAIQLQKKIILNMRENSNIFYPLLQMNSKILKILPDNLWDYLMEKIKSIFNKKKIENYGYTISLEDINEMKSHLLALEEDFFFIIQDVNELNFFGMYSCYSKLTTINQYLLYNEINSISSYDEKKDYAFSMNIIFSHERLGHAKENSCNPQINSPNICFNINFQRTTIYSDDGNKKIGESGILLESFISNKILIKTLKDVKKFGKYLDYNYFIGDFKEINEEAINRFKETKDYFEVKYEITQFIVGIIIIYLSFVSLLYTKELLSINIYQFIIIILTLILLLLIIHSFKEYKEPYKYDHLFDIIDEGKEQIRYIFPDDYPMESESFLGRHFPFLQIKKNKIRKKMKNYLMLSKFHKF